MIKFTPDKISQIKLLNQLSFIFLSGKHFFIQFKTQPRSGSSSYQLNRMNQV